MLSGDSCRRSDAPIAYPPPRPTWRTSNCGRRPGPRCHAGGGRRSFLDARPGLVDRVATELARRCAPAHGPRRVLTAERRCTPTCAGAWRLSAAQRVRAVYEAAPRRDELHPAATVAALQPRARARGVARAGYVGCAPRTVHALDEAVVRGRGSPAGRWADPRRARRSGWRQHAAYPSGSGLLWGSGPACRAPRRRAADVGRARGPLHEPWRPAPPTVQRSSG